MNSVYSLGMGRFVRAIGSHSLFPFLLGVLCIAAYSLLFWIVFVHVFANGLCCSDDAIMGAAAKNLASGYGYGVSVGYGFMPFSWVVTTGPVLLLPAAALIALVGNQYWAPGFVTATTSALLLIAIGLLQFRRTSATSAFTYMLLFGFLLYVLTVSLFSQWYVLMGEIPAALLSVVGALIVTGRAELKPAPTAAASLVFGTAALTKLLALFSYVPLAIWLGINILRAHPSRMGAFQVALISVGCFLTPFVLFETWKLAELGSAGYVANLKTFIEFFGQYTGLSHISHIGAIPVEHTVRFHHFTEAFGVSAWTLLAAAIGVTSAIWFTSKRPARIFTLFLVSAATIYLIWWLFISKMHFPRYALIGVVLLAAALATSVYARPAALALGLVLLILAPQALQYEKLAGPVKAALASGFHENSRLANLREVAAFLTEQRPNRLFVSSWIATFADIEYAMPGVDHFRLPTFLRPIDAEREWILVRNTIWTKFFPIADFAEWEKRCAEVLFDRPPYLASRCPSQKQQLAYLRRLIPDKTSPQPAMRIAEAEVEISVPSTAIYQLDLINGEQGSVEVGFGLDYAKAGMPGPAICFVIKAYSFSGSPTELLRECLSPHSVRVSHPERMRFLSIPPETRRLSFETQSLGTGRAYWSELNIVGAR